MRDIIELAQQRMSGRVVEANQRLEMEQEPEAPISQLSGTLPF
jgi:hypothetical protein